jgi:uncharacterized RDD family membrane protein YckC
MRYTIRDNPAELSFAFPVAAVECVCPEATPRAPSAAQNETVIQTCTQCGAINGAEARTCCLCDTRLPENPQGIFVSASAQLCTDGNASVQTDWRSEVLRHVEAYHVRRGRPRPARIEPEPYMPAVPPLKPTSEGQSFETPPPTITKRRFRPTRIERVEIQVEQSSFDFTSGEPEANRAARAALYDSPMCPVAPLAERRRAGILDAAFLFAAYGGFLMLFHALGGKFSLNRFDVLVTIATFGLLYAQYIILFTYFAGATPGMMLRGLRIASLDGLTPSRRQLLWRSLGYLISAGTMMLGFVWTLWDEYQLSWHDRISQTCITSDAAPLSEPWTEPSTRHNLETPAVHRSI